MGGGDWFLIALFVAVMLVIGVVLYRASPGFRSKADRYVDRDKDGRPFQ